MASYFVSTQGSNANNGTSAATPWLTITKALTTLTPASGGDTVYVAPGIYRETVTPTITPDVTHQVTVTGDPMNQQGFASVTAGEVVLTAFLTNDTTAPSASVPLTLGAKTYFTFQNLTIVGGGGAVVSATANTNHITFTECLLIAHATATVSVVSAADAACNWLIDRCIVICHTGSAISIAPAAFAGSVDVDINFVVQNSLILAQGSGVLVQPTAVTGAGKAYGVKVWDCTLFANPSLRASNANHSTANASQIYNCVIGISSTGIQAFSSGQIVEDFNIIAATTARSNVTAGTHSVLAGTPSITYALMLQFGQERWNGQQIKQFLQPMPGSPVLGFGNQAVSITVDGANRPRPAGAASSNSQAVGYLERHNSATKETSVTDAGSVAINLVCPGDHDIQIPVTVASTAITIKYRSDAGVTPTAQVLANGEIGVSASAVQSGSTGQGSYTTLTIPSFTPTAVGLVVLRLGCTGTAGNKAYFDTLAVTPVPNMGDMGFFKMLEPAAVNAGASGGGLLINSGMQGGLRG